MRIIADAAGTDEVCWGTTPLIYGQAQGEVAAVAAGVGLGAFVSPPIDVGGRHMAVTPALPGLPALGPGLPAQSATNARGYGEETNEEGISAQVDWDLGNMNFTSITAFRHWDATRSQDIDFGVVDIAYRDGLDVTFEHVTQESRLQGENGPLNWLVGVFYGDEGISTPGLKNYAHLVALGPWEGYPSPKEQQEAHAQAKDLQRIICHQVFVQNGNRLEGIPAKACGCNVVINSMLTQADEQRRAEAAYRTTYREAARKDSIGRVEVARNAELSMAIYAPDGRLRIDTTMRLATTAIDSLNRVLLASMLHAAGSMFRTGPDAATDWELLASVLQKGRPLLWVQRMRKKGNLFELERVTTGDPGSHFRLEILSDD